MFVRPFPKFPDYCELTMAASRSCASFQASTLKAIGSAFAVDRLDMICLA